MSVRYIGIISGGFYKQTQINIEHARDIGSVLADTYEVTYYNLASSKDINRLIENHRLKKLDLVFNNAAGKKGGDGTVEGFLEILGIPYVGSDTLATAVAFDKKTTKALVADFGVPIIRGMSINETEFKANKDEIIAAIEKKIRYPLVVKASQGSDSIGVTLVKKPEDLMPAIKTAYAEDDNIIVEDFIKRKAEVTCMVIGTGAQAKALDPVERVYETEILYPKDITDRSYRYPETIKEEALAQIRAFSVIAHRVVGCADYSRSDFLVSKSGKVYFLELNGHAGLGRGGPTEFAAKYTRKWSYERMIKEILQRGIDRHYPSK